MLRWIAAMVFVVGAGSAFAGVPTREIETRAKCITHEGADLAAAPKGSPGAAMAAARNAQCPSELLAGTACANLDGGAARACLAKELTVWNGVLDLLVRVAAENRRKQGSVRAAVAAFRNYRDTACTTFNAIAVNPGGAETVALCRVEESARFAQRIYDHFYSP